MNITQDETTVTILDNDCRYQCYCINPKENNYIQLYIRKKIALSCPHFFFECKAITVTCILSLSHTVVEIGFNPPVGKAKEDSGVVVLNVENRNPEMERNVKLHITTAIIGSANSKLHAIIRREDKLTKA